MFSNVDSFWLLDLLFARSVAVDQIAKSKIKHCLALTAKGIPQRSLLVAIRLNLHEFSLIYQTVTCSW